MDRMECGLRGGKIGYEVTERWLHILRVIEEMG